MTMLSSSQLTRNIMLPFTSLPNHVPSSILEQFEKNCERHLLACDLEIRARRMMKCFANIAGTLPVPGNSMHNVWNLLPNGTTDAMPMPINAGVVFLRAPPPTPTDTIFAVANEVVESDDLGWSQLNETSSPTPDTMTFEVVFDPSLLDQNSSNAASERCQSIADEDTTLESNDSAESSLPGSNQDHSDNQSGLFSQPNSPVFAGEFEQIVDEKITELRLHGLVFVVESLLEIGVQNVQSAPLVSMVVQSMLVKMTKESAKTFVKALRVAALEAFRQHWKQDGHWRRVCSTSHQHSALTLVGVNKAGLMGSLFCAKISTAEDITLSLLMLLEEVHFDRLCAMHAILLQANDRLCKTRNVAALMQCKEQLFLVDPVTDLYLWAPAPHAQALLQDIFETIDGWMATQAHKRARYDASSLTRKQTSLKAAGPRLRQGRTRNRA